MSALELRRKAKKRIDGLSPESLKFTLDFMEFLDEREEEDATEELMRIPGFGKAMEKAERDIAAGRVTPVEKLRRKYKRV